MSFLVNQLSAAVKALLLAIAAVSLLGYLGQWGWWLDLFSHFRLQYLFIVVLGSAILVVTLQWRWVVFGVLLSVACALPMWPQLRPLVKPVAPPAILQPASQVSILQFNLWVRNKKMDQSLKYIFNADADIVGLEEVDAEWWNAIEASGLLQRYPHYRYYQDQLLLSRLPITASTVVHKNTIKGDIVATVTTHQNKALTVVLMHTATPFIDHFNDQLAEFTVLSEALAGQPRPLIVMGDLNATPWSYPMNVFLKNTNLIDSQQYVGLQPSWPVVVSWPWLAIDHVLVSPGIQVLDRHIGPAQGSDHAPLHCDIAF